MKTGIPKNTVRRFVTGLTQELPVDDLMRLCRAIGISPLGATSYMELAIEAVNGDHLHTREDALRWLIGHQGAVAARDLANIELLHREGLVSW